MGQFSKNYRTSYQKSCQKALKNMVLGSGIRDPRSGIRKKPIPDPGSRGQKVPDPGSGSETLLVDRRIRIRANKVRIRMRNQDAQKHTDPEH